jgi:hypothetical protein
LSIFKNVLAKGFEEPFSLEGFSTSLEIPPGKTKGLSPQLQISPTN